MTRVPVLPLLAIAGVVAAAYVVATSGTNLLPAAPLTAPAQTPFLRTVAGAGLVEPSTRPIAVGTPIAGVVAEVLVAVGDRVQAGQPLLRVDDRALRAELAVRQAAERAAAAHTARLAAAPRPETLPPARARVAEAQARRDEAALLVRNLEAVTDPRAVRQEDLQQRRSHLAAADAQLAAAEAEFALLRAGTWPPELAEAEAAQAAAAAAVAQTLAELERLVVRAPRAATVLQVDVRAGEHAQASSGAAGDRLLLLGDVDVLHVRVDVDEHDAFRVRPGARAVASMRGAPDRRVDLRFVHIEPFVVPKKSLTGSSFERVDTRVLQVVYAFDPKALAAYAGQQLDVFIEAEASR